MTGTSTHQSFCLIIPIETAHKGAVFPLTDFHYHSLTCYLPFGAFFTFFFTYALGVNIKFKTTDI